MPPLPQQGLSPVESLASWLVRTWLFRDFPYGSDALGREPVLSVPLMGLSIGVIPLDLGFWVSTFVLLSLQTLMNIAVGFVTFRCIVQEPNPRTRYLLGYGLLLPGCLLVAPYTYSTLPFPNVALMLCLCGAVPVMMPFRVIQAMHQQLPEYASKSQAMLILYFSSTLQIQFDAATQQPVPLTRHIFRTKLTAFVRVLVQTSVLYSLLLPHKYQIFPQTPITQPGISMPGETWQMPFSWLP
jgi:hypothetical protein